MREIECVQGQPEWWEARRGIPTASEFDRILTPIKKQPSAAQTGYIASLIADATCMLPNWFADRPSTKDMDHGKETEPQARAWYEMERGVQVRQVGFCVTDDGRFGCSPDGLIDPDGGLELKCPKLSTHTAWLMADKVPDEYLPQIHGCLIVTGRQWWDFVSYSPARGLPPLLKRVFRDEYTIKLAVELELFDERLKETYLKLTRRPNVAT